MLFFGIVVFVKKQSVFSFLLLKSIYLIKISTFKIVSFHYFSSQIFEPIVNHLAYRQQLGAGFGVWFFFIISNANPTVALPYCSWMISNIVISMVSAICNWYQMVADSAYMCVYIDRDDERW